MVSFRRIPNHNTEPGSCGPETSQAPCDQEEAMKRLMCLGVGVSIVACAVAVVGAQAPAQDASKGKTVTITGCLAAGADAKTFMLSDAMPAAAAKEQSKEAPKSSEMRSYRVTAGESAVKLADHVGHRVTLTGTVEQTASTAAPGAAGTSGTAGTGKPIASLTATALKHVSPTCTQ
jgi:hypothetical protein